MNIVAGTYAARGESRGEAQARVTRREEPGREGSTRSEVRVASETRTLDELEELNTNEDRDSTRFCHIT